MTGTLNTRNLTVHRGGTAVLHAIDSDFTAGRVTVVLGANGAGKSTLLGALAGLRTPAAGVVALGGRPRADWPARDLARRIGYLPQSADVHWDIDVATLVGLGRTAHRGRWGDGAADKAAIARAIAATDLGALAHRAVGTLSGGERARALLARALAGEPGWLLADEPFASLDIAHVTEAAAQLRAVAAGGAGVIVVLHDLVQAARLADDVLLLRGGRVVAAGPAADTLTARLLAQTYGAPMTTATLADGRRIVIGGA